MNAATKRNAGLLPGMLFLITVIVSSCLGGKKEGAFTALNRMLGSEFSDDEPGGSVLIQKGDSVLFLKNMGVADLTTREKITENTLFNLGSISKTFVANGILILNERGLLSLDDCIGRYFDDFDNKNIAENVKIYHLLSHTSGLPDCRNVDDNIEFYITAKDTANFEPLKHVEKLNFQPGERFEYSNPAYNGLALIIEKVSGEPWQKFIEDNILIPSGMTGSTITDGPHPSAGVAHGYELRDGVYCEYDYGEYPTFAAAGNGGVWSSVTELAQYEAAIRDNIFLGEKLTEESRTPFTPVNWADTVRPFIGYSWFIGEESLFDGKSSFKVKIVYHKGDQGGFRAFFVTIPEKEIVFTGLFNRPPENMDGIIMEGLTLLAKNNLIE